MAKFIYNKIKYVSTNHILFKLNYIYHPRIFFKNVVNLLLKSRSANKLAKELKYLMSTYQQNLLYNQEL